VRETDGNGEVEETLEVREGALWIEAVDPGLTRFVLTRGHDRFAPADYWTAARFELQLNPGEERDQRVQLEAGGALVVEMTDGGRRVEGSCRILNSQGEEVRRIFVANDRGGGRIAGWNYLFDCGPNRAVPDLAAGNYEIVVEGPDGREVHRSFQLRAGKTRVLELEISAR